MRGEKDDTNPSQPQRCSSLFTYEMWKFNINNLTSGSSLPSFKFLFPQSLLCKREVNNTAAKQQSLLWIAAEKNKIKKTPGCKL